MDRKALAIVLGGADNVWQDYERAKALCPDHDVAAVNEAGRDYPGHLTLWCSLHAEKLGDWQRQRQRAGRNTDYIAVSNKGHAEARIDRLQNEIWSGTSGLYVCQVAILNYGYQRIILCGVPMQERPHYHSAEPWPHAGTYRRGWIEATQQQELKGRIRSMSGWSRELLGSPDAAWLAVPAT